MKKKTARKRRQGKESVSVNPAVGHTQRKQSITAELSDESIPCALPTCGAIAPIKSSTSL